MRRQRTARTETWRYTLDKVRGDMRSVRVGRTVKVRGQVRKFRK